MTNEEYYRDKIFRIACNGDCLAVRNGVLGGCYDAVGCDGCIRLYEDSVRLKGKCDTERLTEWLNEVYIPTLTRSQRQELEYMVNNGFSVLSSSPVPYTEVYGWYAWRPDGTRSKECEQCYKGLDNNTDYDIRALLNGEVLEVKPKE